MRSPAMVGGEVGRDGGAVAQWRDLLRGHARHLRQQLVVRRPLARRLVQAGDDRLVSADRLALGGDRRDAARR